MAEALEQKSNEVSTSSLQGNVKKVAISKRSKDSNPGDNNTAAEKSSKKASTSNEDSETTIIDDTSTSTLKKVKKVFKLKLSSSKSDEDSETAGSDNPSTSSLTCKTAETSKASAKKVSNPTDKEVAGNDDSSTSTLKKARKIFKMKESSDNSEEKNATVSTDNPSSSLNALEAAKSKALSKKNSNPHDDDEAERNDYSTATLKKIRNAFKSKAPSTHSDEEYETADTNDTSSSSLTVPKAMKSKAKDSNPHIDIENEECNRSTCTLKKIRKTPRASSKSLEEENEGSVYSSTSSSNVPNIGKSKALSKRNSNSEEDITAGEDIPSTSTLKVAKAKDAIKAQTKKVAANVRVSASYIGQGAEKTTKALINTTESVISVAPEKAEKIASKLDSAASSAYEDTKHAIRNPKEVVKDIKKMASVGRGDMEKAMKTVKLNGQRFADEVDGAMEKLVAISEEHLLPTSKQHLIDSELGVLKDSDSEYRTRDVEVDRDITIHTICFEEKRRHRFRSRLPLVLLHGLGGGLPCFHKNYSTLCQDRKVYGIDLPGFALSSRMPLPKSAKECRDKIVDLLDKWRAAMDIKIFVLLGHSFGGYLAAAYTVKHHTHVRHLILADSWGIIPKEEDKMRDDPQMWQRAAMCISNSLKSNPFDILRGSGPLGPVLAEKFLPEELKIAYGEDCTGYFYHALAQSNATGEGAFSVISEYEYLWPADAMKPHLIKLSTSVPITFIYGETSPFHNQGGTEIRVKRKNIFVLDPLPGIGHHVQAQDADLFNSKVLGVLYKVDKNSDKCKKGK